MTEDRTGSNVHVDPSLPVIVGVGQVTHRLESPADAVEPLVLMEEATREAIRDAGRDPSGVLDLVAVVRGAWSYGDPARLLAERVGAPQARTAMSADGGNAPQMVLNELFRRISGGRLRAALLIGGEAIYSRRKARSAGIDIQSTRQVEGTAPDEVIGGRPSLDTPYEVDRGLTAPVVFYSLFEDALRTVAGRTTNDHRRKIAELWSRFSAVAASTPCAWSRSLWSPDDLLQDSSENRMVAFPYTKRLCSNWFTDQAAAVLVCSAGTADELGVSRDRWVFPLSGADGHDTQHVSNRQALGASPAIRVAGRHALDLAGVGVDDLTHIDLYSCFPSAVEVAAAELGIDLDRPLTVTGGLAYFGGPLNNYVSHSVVEMAGRLRDEPGAIGLVSANGGYLTKHAFGLYSTSPPTGYRSATPQAQIDSAPRVDVDETYVGRAVVEAASVGFGDGEPVKAVAACRTPSGARTWATSVEPDVLTVAVESGLGGTEISIGPKGTLFVGS